MQVEISLSADGRELLERLRLLEGMQGLDQGLVGESRSGSPTGPAEEAKPGERGVEEIVERNVLLRHLDRRIGEAQKGVMVAMSSGIDMSYHTARVKLAALVELRGDIERMAAKRSDLLNAGVLAHADEKLSDQ